MPKIVHEEVGKIYRTRKINTFGDKVREFIEKVAGAGVIIVILLLIFNW